MNMLLSCLAFSIAAVSAHAQDSSAANVADASAFGAVGDGKSDDTANLQRALDSGKRIRLTPGRTYAVSSRLTIPSMGGLISDGTAEILALASGFDNTDPSPHAHYQKNSDVIDASGATTAPFTPARKIEIRGIKLRFEWTEGRVVDAIVARNVDGLLIDRMDISRFPVGAGIKVATITGNSAIRNNVIHDFSSNTNFLRAYPKSNAQLTAIEVDDDRINGRGSQNLAITGNRISNITVGPVFLAAQGYQTDGINVENDAATGTVIENNVISHTGEGIDNWGVHGRIANNTITDSYQFGIKLIHGASDNQVVHNTITRTGLAGILLAGSKEGPHATQNNMIADNSVTDIDPDGVWAEHETSCIQLSDNNGTTWKAQDNVFIRNRLDPGKSGKWAVNVRNNTGGRNDFSKNPMGRTGVRGLMSSGDSPK
ncbi:MAG: right-handed parallel beta-helix repeat-containing protein [Burkholderiaceae bacterium]|jgi:hypothetical protein